MSASLHSNVNISRMLHAIVVHTPEAAVEICKWLHNAKQEGQISSIHKGLKIIGKNRQTIQICKHIYHMHMQDEDLYKEVGNFVDMTLC